MNWINVNDRLPEGPVDRWGYSERKLVCCDDGSIGFGVYNVEEKEWEVSFGEVYEPNILVTHWMPLPDKP